MRRGEGGDGACEYHFLFISCGNDDGHGGSWIFGGRRGGLDGLEKARDMGGRRKMAARLSFIYFGREGVAGRAAKSTEYRGGILPIKCVCSASVHKNRFSLGITDFGQVSIIQSLRTCYNIVLMEGEEGKRGDIGVRSNFDLIALF